MTKSYRNLWPQIVAWDNLLAAYRKCRRGKRYELEAARFDFDWEHQLLALQQELVSGGTGDTGHF